MAAVTPCYARNAHKLCAELAAHASSERGQNSLS